MTDNSSDDKYYRGKYLIDESWSNDKTKNYYEGFKIRHGYPILKIVTLLAIFYAITNYLGLSTKMGLLVILIIVT